MISDLFSLHRFDDLVTRTSARASTSWPPPL